MPINSPPPMPSSSSKLKKKKKLAVLDANTISSSGSDSWKKLKILEGEDSCGGNLIGAAAAARDLHLDGDGDYDVPAVSTEEQQECQVVELRLPVDRFKMNKKLWEEKERLLVKRGLSLGLQFQVPIPTFTDSDLATQLERLVKTSRILHLDEKELYFVEDADDGPFSTINELESLYTIWSLIECLKSDAKPQGEKVLQFLQELTSDKINALCPEYPDKETFKEEAEDGKELLKWGRANGMTADKLNITLCPHVLRYELCPEMDHTTIIFRASRPCKKGEQCFISYGNRSGCDLVKSYGFLPLGYNLYDVLTLDLGEFVGGIDIIQRNDGFSWPTAMLRTIPYSKSRILPTRLVVGLSASLANTIGDNSDDITKPYVREVLEKLLCGLLDLGWECQDVWRCDDDESDSFEPPLIWKSDGTCVIDVDNEIMTKPYHRKHEYEWDMKLVRRYKFVMRSLVISAVRSCENTLKKL